MKNTYDHVKDHTVRRSLVLADKYRNICKSQIGNLVDEYLETPEMKGEEEWSINYLAKCAQLHRPSTTIHNDNTPVSSYSLMMRTLGLPVLMNIDYDWFSVRCPSLTEGSHSTPAWLYNWIARKVTLRQLHNVYRSEKYYEVVNGDVPTDQIPMTQTQWDEAWKKALS